VSAARRIADHKSYSFALIIRSLRREIGTPKNEPKQPEADLFHNPLLETARRISTDAERDVQ
jgi:hypothetical protein